MDTERGSVCDKEGSKCFGGKAHSGAWRTSCSCQRCVYHCTTNNLLISMKQSGALAEKIEEEDERIDNITHFMTKDPIDWRKEGRSR